MAYDPLEQEGYAAFVEGADLDDCPYAEGTDGQEAWCKGFRRAETAANERAL